MSINPIATTSRLQHLPHYARSLNLLPPWNLKPLSARCEEINQNIGNRENNYVDLLNLLLNATVKDHISGKSPTSEILGQLNNNLVAIFQKMPSDIKKREGIRAVLAKMFFQSNYFQHLLPINCAEINQQIGSRESNYIDLLNLVFEAAVNHQTPEIIGELSANLLTILQNIPSDVKTREGIKKVLAKIFFQSNPFEILGNVCLQTCQSIESEAIFSDILNLMQFFLQRGITFPDWGLIGQCLALIKHHIPCEMRENDPIKYLILQNENSLMSVFRNYCFSINSSQRENIIIANQGVLNQIERATQYQTIIEELLRLSQYLLLATQFMTLDTKRTPDIQRQISRIKQNLYGAFYTYFSPLKHSLFVARSSQELESINRKITMLKPHFPKELDPDLAKEIEKCSSFSTKKFNTRSFVERAENALLAGEVGPNRCRARSIYPILSIDGGGIRGIIPATVLVAIEKITSEPIANLFQMIGGTSTGGILALGLTKPNPNSPESPEYRAQDLLNLYAKEPAQIFRRNPLYQEDISNFEWKEQARERICNPKYITPALFQERFRDTRLSSALTDVVITANTQDAIFSKIVGISITGISTVIALASSIFGKPTQIWSHDSIPKEVHLFTKQGLKSLSYSLGDIGRHYEPLIPRHTFRKCPEISDFLMADIVKVTSAAPSYFPSVRYNDREFMDGGGCYKITQPFPVSLKHLKKGMTETIYLCCLLGLA